MEPRSFNRGDGGLDLEGVSVYRLQWSHGRLTVVTESYVWITSASHRFNGATVV